MRRAVAAVVSCRRCSALALLLAACVAVAARAQVARLRPSDEQLKIAEAEVGRLLTLLRLEPGMSVADVGAGLGAWAFRFARVTGPAGRVYATDIDDAALTALRAGVTREGLSNVTVLAGAVDATNLPAACDAILLRNVYHYVTQPEAMNRSLAASLKSGGRLAIADFPPRPNSPLPPGVPANRGGNGIPPEIVEREIGAVLRHVTTVLNWSPESTPPGIPLELGRPYVVIFDKSR
jgi:SAM-dependent methyltransferase